MKLSVRFFKDIFKIFILVFIVSLITFLIALLTVLFFKSCDCISKRNYINGQISVYEKNLSKTPNGFNELIENNYLKETDMKCEAGKHIFVYENGRVLIIEDKTEKIKKEENLKECHKKVDKINNQIKMYKKYLPDEILSKHGLVVYGYLDKEDFVCADDQYINILDGDVVIEEEPRFLPFSFPFR